MHNQKSHRKFLERNAFAIAPAIIAFISLECIVIAQAVLAYRSGFLTVVQMRQLGINQGLPFVWHFAMWGDLFIISELASYIIGRYLRQWNNRQMLISLLLGLSLSALLHWTYTFSEIPEAHAQNHLLTGAGVLHFFYMAVAFAIFTQFFFFTKDVSSKLLIGVSVLLSAHVFIGTHMVLGIIAIIFPLDWYSGQPLKNLFGWAIVATVVIGLTWRCVGTSTIANKFKNIYRLVLWGINQNPDTSEGYLKLWDYLGDAFLTVGFFGGLAFSAWRQHENTFSIALIIVIGIVFYLSRLSVNQELEIVKSLFPPDRVPDDLKPKDRLTIGLEIILYFAVYMFLGWVTKYIIVASLGLFVIACIDFNTRRLIHEKMRQYFSSEKYAPDQNERMYETIQSRRSVIKWFLFKLPHLKKEAGKVIGCAVSVCIAIYGYFGNVEWAENLAYVTLIGTLITNEIFTMMWRLERDRQLKII